jgi:mechanosensitive ion channel-like protein
VNVQDQSPLEVANHVAVKVKQHARPWRSIISLILAIGAGIVASAQNVSLDTVFKPGPLAPRIIWASTTVAYVIFGLAAVVGLAGKSRDILAPRVGTGHAAVIRYSIMLVGALITFFVILELLGVPVTQLLVGGAVTTIFIGIAAQQSLGNVFAGIVLLFSRPFAVGDSVVLRSGALSGPIEGVVVEIGITYVRLETGDGVMYLPNSQVLAAGVGHIRPAAPAPPTLEPPTAHHGAGPDGASGSTDGVSSAGGAAKAPATSSRDGGAPGGGAPGGDAPGSGGRPLSPPGL